jgi:hypothetical protein
MSLITNITEIAGIPPYNVYVCNPDGTGCFYINTITSAPYSFIIPPPKNNLSEYMLLLKDANARIISGITSVT